MHPLGRVYVCCRLIEESTATLQKDFLVCPIATDGIIQPRNYLSFFLPALYICQAGSLAASEFYCAVNCLVFKTLIRKETEATRFFFISRNKV